MRMKAEMEVLKMQVKKIKINKDASQGTPNTTNKPTTRARKG